MLLEGRNIVVDIAGRKIVDQESVQCPAGQMTALVGPSGSGKTTLLHCLGLLLPPDSGSVTVDGRDLTRASMRARRRFWRDDTSFVLQDYGIMDDESVAFNVTMRKSASRQKAKDSRLQDALDRTGLGGRESDRSGVLSGGEKQRLALARAIYKGSSILLVDEPTASLDAANRQKVVQLFTDFASLGKTVVISTHDDEMIAACGVVHGMGGQSNASKGDGRLPVTTP